MLVLSVFLTIIHCGYMSGMNLCYVRSHCHSNMSPLSIVFVNFVRLSKFLKEEQLYIYFLELRKFDTRVPCKQSVKYIR